MATDLVTVFGGTGFLGRAIVRRLVKAHKRVRVAARHPSTDQTAGIEQVSADIRDEAGVEAALAGAQAAVNCVALYVERGQETFQSMHVQGAWQLAQQAERQKLNALIHVSGIGADLRSSSPYVRARAKGEHCVRETFPRGTILRPSVLFGPHDAFLTTLDQVTRQLPAIPLFGRGNTRMQPVYVEDVAEAVARSLEQPATLGVTYELGGAETYTYRTLLERLLHYRQRRRLLVPVPFPVWDLLAGLFSVLPSPPVTRDQIALMRQDNVVSTHAPSFANLGIQPRLLSELLPVCLVPSA